MCTLSVCGGLPIRVLGSGWAALQAIAAADRAPKTEWGVEVYPLEANLERCAMRSFPPVLLPL